MAAAMMAKSWMVRARCMVCWLVVVCVSVSGGSMIWAAGEVRTLGDGAGSARDAQLEGRRKSTYSGRHSVPTFDQLYSSRCVKQWPSQDLKIVIADAIQLNKAHQGFTMLLNYDLP